MKTHKPHTDTSSFFNYAFPVLDNEFDMELYSSPNRFILDEESMLLRGAILPDNDNFDVMELG